MRPRIAWAGSICSRTLPDESRLALSRTAQEHIFAAGEAIVRQDEAGDSMYVVLTRPRAGDLEPSGQEVAVIESGGFFGEMSMLTGDPRTATVRAIDDVRALEIPAERFRAVALERPGLVEHISRVVSTPPHRARSRACHGGHAGQGRRARHAVREDPEVSRVAW